MSTNDKRDAREAAVSHVQQMTARVQNQESLVDRLKSDGGDASQEIARLLLLRRALEEMTLYLPRLLPSDDPTPPRSAEAEQMLSWWLGDRSKLRRR